LKVKEKAEEKAEERAEEKAEERAEKKEASFTHRLAPCSQARSQCQSL
jgi:hypothetical protein